VLVDLQFVIEDNQAEISGSNLPKIYGNEVQIIQLLQNLLSNAIKFRRAETPKVQITAQRQRREWVFSVTDNGIGIEKQYLERIFDVFQRLHDKDKYPGTGIGLAICKKVVQNHNGRIWVKSEFNCGTTFYFALPAGRAGAGTEEKA
jgi:two-component system, chemotaxis family, sensor kinase Cph1